MSEDHAEIIVEEPEDLYDEAVARTIEVFWEKKKTEWKIRGKNAAGALFVVSFAAGILGLSGLGLYKAGQRDVEHRAEYVNARIMSYIEVNKTYCIERDEHGFTQYWMTDDKKNCLRPSTMLYSGGVVWNKVEQ